MKALIFGAVLGVLLLWPAALSLTAAVLAAIFAKPVVIVFGLGVAAGLRTPWLRRWAR